MEMSNLASGLLGSLIGACLGAAATFWGQKHLGDQDVQRRRVGIVRALVSELMQNGAAVTSVVYQGANVVEYSTEVWRASRFDLAQFLPGKLYEDVDYLYMMLPGVQGLAVPPVSDEVRGLLEKWIQGLKGTLRALRDLPYYTRTESDRLGDLVDEIDSQMRRTTEATP